ncbi:MAG: hypothetical protein MK208_20420 [Shimia sp.]|jgi:hypothetical protein|uniref:hypothetical protein n=1 Tax=Shimia sp. TaxID=1954381 RepID=UPI0025CD6152|nr:hypothetical protein [Shimia sp.]MCH2069607.1 hypothetical protein [Shimia sp.]
MQIVLHAGAHFTDEGKLLGSLSQNRDLLAQNGIALPPQSTYRRQIRDTLGQMNNATMAADYKGAIMGGMIGDAKPDRMILSNDNFFGVPRRAIRDNCLFPTAGDRLRGVSSLFYGEDLEIFMAIRNPATFVPALVAASPNHPIEEVTDNCDPLALRWSELILRIRDAVPHMPVTVWCNEDTPIIWEEIMRDMAGLDPATPVAGGTDLLRSIMSDEGMARLEAFLADHPGVTEIQKRRIYAAFLDKFAIEDEIEEELDLPGWTVPMVDHMTQAYDEDVYRIERIPGVTVLTP